ncbi:MAG: hypothetical protein K1X83_02850 [Oligoflexia bacterium]|nr:hypothetical protein [Oligoflexia bacterium]
MKGKGKDHIRTDVEWFGRRYFPLMFFLLLIGLSVVFINSNQLYHFLSSSAGYDSAARIGNYRFELSPERTFENADQIKIKLRDLKISFPLSYELGACELFYAGAILGFREGAGVVPGPGQFSYRNTRLLLKFRYDLKNKRCESKDISIVSGDLPESIKLQFVATRLEAQRLVETPDPHGVMLNFSDPLHFSAQLIDVPPQAPFLSSRTTKRNTLFSVPRVPQTELMIHPYQSLNDFVAQELERRIQRCRSERSCAPIWMAVAKITDRRLLELLDQAQIIGLPVEAISNYRYRLDQEMDDWDSGPQEFQFSPWFWLRGSPFSQYGAGRLPMHTKFVIFGDDFVVSSNPSLRGGLRNRSREYSLIYRDTAVIDIFKEIFALVRSSFYYPLKVDLTHDLVLLFNAVRPRQYSISAEKPYVAIDTNEGVRSNAYGVLYELLDRHPGQLDMAMSPITDSCAPYRSEHCLFELLENRAARQDLSLTLNGLYYTPVRNRPAVSDRATRFWDAARFKAALDGSAPLQIFRSWFGSKTEALTTYIEFSRPMSTHHERAALLGDDVSILGSANWANTSTINTIEVLRSKSLNSELRNEFQTFKDPWFVSLRENGCTNPSCFGRCEFSFELGNPPVVSTPQYRVSKQQLLTELKRQHPEAQLEGLQLVIPNQQSGLNRPLKKEDLSAAAPNFQLFPLQDDFFSPSAYLCLTTPDHESSYVARLPIQFLSAQQ